MSMTRVDRLAGYPVKPHSLNDAGIRRLEATAGTRADPRRWRAIRVGFGAACGRSLPFSKYLMGTLALTRSRVQEKTGVAIDCGGMAAGNRHR